MGIFSKFFCCGGNQLKGGLKPLTIALIGLDNAGKSTLFCALKGELDPDTVPTVGFHKPLVFDHEDFSVTVFDLGGGPRIRAIWPDYFPDVHGAIFIVDSQDSNRLEESKESLVSSIKHKYLKGKPILIFANKQDLPQSLAEHEIGSKFNLDSITEASTNVVNCIAKASCNGGVMDSRIGNGLSWLVHAIEKEYSMLQERIQEETAVHREENRKRREEQDKRVAENKKRREANEEQVKAEDEKEEEEYEVPKCVLCKTEPAVRRCAAAAWQAVCEDCGVKAEKALEQKDKENEPEKESNSKQNESVDQQSEHKDSKNNNEKKEKDNKIEKEEFSNVVEESETNNNNNNNNETEKKSKPSKEDGIAESLQSPVYETADQSSKQEVPETPRELPVTKPDVPAAVEEPKKNVDDDGVEVIELGNDEVTEQPTSTLPPTAQGSSKSIRSVDNSGSSRQMGSSRGRGRGRGSFRKGGSRRGEAMMMGSFRGMSLKDIMAASKNAEEESGAKPSNNEIEKLPAVEENDTEPSMEVSQTPVVKKI
eukprot:TRINITY_DN412_c0_g1_i1.p1 TRINITY_DN412_c0_g1~~TRINITY_DN412_c0_g1_i1.p1  ORF type:complete len:538 (+),score=199.09 TRINITY_DN412_c0_g1_i1:62-1675(+)